MTWISRAAVAAAAAAVFALAAAPSRAQTAAAAERAGIWEGTLGNLAIRACFDEPGPSPGTPRGGYFYLSHLRLIRLYGSEAPAGTYGEGGDVATSAAARWQLEPPQASEMRGQWTGAGGGRTLPIRLTRVAPPLHNDDSCASRAFHAPRLARIRILERPALLGRFAYTRLLLDHGGAFANVKVETFRLDGAGEGIARINARLRAPLGDAEESWFECIQSTLVGGMSEGDTDETLVPTLATRRWLVVRRNADSYCGGAHPNTEVEALVFDRATGRPVRLLDWLSDRAVRREPGEGRAEDGAAFSTLRPAFKAMILAGWKPANAECRRAVAEEDFWQADLTPVGFVFSPNLPRVVMACGDQFRVGFARLAPYLTSQGGAWAAEVMRERPAGR